MSDTVCVVGLGYVGYPLARAFAKHIDVIGFEISSERLEFLRATDDSGMELTDDSARIRDADFILICVPTPVTESKHPDFGPMLSAAKTVGLNMRKGAIVVVESTVYPGATEEDIVPILENESGMVCSIDFKVGYSPERINPGDKDHDVDKIIKVVAGMDEDSSEKLRELYSLITTPFMAKDIKTAEAAKVIENVQRDLNIALVNELSMIFEKMGIDTHAVLDAAQTKWNFTRYNPGLVGGHCIPVDPYYLTYKAEKLGYHSKVILAGRQVNDDMPRYVAQKAMKAINDAGRCINGSRLLILGLTYKENVPDTRESPVPKMVKEFKEFGVDVFGYDPLLNGEALNGCGLTLTDYQMKDEWDCILLTSGHEAFLKDGSKSILKAVKDGTVVFDVRKVLNREAVIMRGGIYLTL